MGLDRLRASWDARSSGDFVDRMLYLDLKYYLPGLGLAYMDKASMAASVEVRVPLLDDEVVETVSRLPGDKKVKGSKTKIVLREALRGRIPNAILRRRKAPFSAPIRSWLRGPLEPGRSELWAPRNSGRGGLSTRKWWNESLPRIGGALKTIH